MRAIFALPAYALLVSCSPYVYSDQAGKFSDNIGTATTAYQQGQKDDLADQRNIKFAEWLNGSRPRLQLSPDCADATKVCTIVTIADGQQRREVFADSSVTAPQKKTDEKDACDTVRAPAFPDPNQPNKGIGDASKVAAKITGDQIFTIVQQYADGLKAVTKSSDKDDFNTAKTKLATSVGKMVTAAGAAFGGVGVAAGPIAEASTNIVLWLVGADLDHQRYTTLRQQTIKACRPIKVLAGAIEFIVEIQRGNRLDTLNKELGEHFRTLDRIRSRSGSSDQVYMAEITATYAALDQYEAVRKVDPFAMESGIDDAHDTLVLAIYNNDGQLTAVTTALEELGDNVGKLRDATKTTSASNTSTTKTN